MNQQAVTDRFTPGEIITGEGDIEINAGRPNLRMQVSNSGDRPIQVGSHYHFAETNTALSFDRKAAHGMRLNIASGTAVRFEPGQSRQVELVAYAGKRVVYGFNQLVMGPLDKKAKPVEAATQKSSASKIAAQKSSAKKSTAKKPLAIAKKATPARSKK